MQSRSSPIMHVLTTHQLNNPQNEAHTHHKPTATACAIDASVSFEIEHIATVALEEAGKGR